MATLKTIRTWKIILLFVVLPFIVTVGGGLLVLYIQYKKGVEMIDVFFSTFPQYSIYIVIAVLILAAIMQFYGGYLIGVIRAGKRGYYWLIEYAQKQEQNIATSIEIDNVLYSSGDLDGRPTYSIVFALSVFNKSVFPITFEEAIGKKLIYDYKPLELSPKFAEEIPVIEPLGTSCLMIEQRLEKDEAESILRALDRYEAQCIERSLKTVGGYPIPATIQFKDLILTIKSTDNFPKVLSQPTNNMLLEFEITKQNFHFSSKAVRAWGANQPIITPIKTTPWDFQWGENGRVIKGGGAEGKPLAGWALMAEFFSVPTDYPDIPIKVKAIITFTNLDNGIKTRVNDGVWYDENSNYKTFQTGDAAHLVVGYYDNKRSNQLARYEYEGKKGEFQAGAYLLDGENFEIDVELLGKHKRKNVFQQNFKFKFVKRGHSFDFKQITSRDEKES